MSWQVSRPCGRSMLTLCLIAVAGALVVVNSKLAAQAVVQGIGGITINSHGVVSQPTLADRHAFLKLVREQMRAAPDDLHGAADLRKVSLRQLQAAIAVAIENNQPIPTDAQFLAGLQAIKYVLVYPEQQDIVLAGPGEGWTVDPIGTVVGVTTGKPVLLLDDLLVALRSSFNARQVGISCSIDPTKEGIQAMRQFLRNQKTFHPRVAKGMKQALGPQQITIRGVPTDSHFARVLVTADYRMKRYAMNIEPAPIAGVPSFIELLAKSGARLGNAMPRWWLACDYQPLARSEDGLAWQLRGTGVKAMTEDDFVAADGTVEQTGRANPIAQKWADRFTTKFEELATHDTVFGQLRNLMDLAVAAALIDHEDLLGVAGCNLDLLYGANQVLDIVHGLTPRTVDSESSFLKRGRNYIVTASGGVQIDSWQVVGQAAETDPQLSGILNKAVPIKGGSWRWD